MIVVTGATGNIGRPLLELLARQGAETVAVSRRQHVDGLPADVRHAQADPGEAASLRSVLNGADTLLLMLGGELNVHGEDPGAVVAVAREAGVKRLVLVSSQLCATRPQVRSHDRLRQYEAAVRAFGPDHVILRPGGFASNALGWAESVRANRTVLAPFGDVALPVIDPADIAAVAAAVLLGDGHAGRDYVLTGPQAVSPRDQAAAISRALGEEVGFVELTRAQAHAGMSAFMPEFIVEGTLDVLAEPLPSEHEVSPDVERLLGRAARPFGDWAARHLAAFR